MSPSIDSFLLTQASDVNVVALSSITCFDAEDEADVEAAEAAEEEDDEEEDEEEEGAGCG